MNESFGAHLRHERERREIPLESIASSTKIKLGLLEGLENDDVSHWPSGIFRRAFIRSYAKAIGLEPDAIAREFLQRHPDPFEMEAAPEPVTGEAVSPSAGSATWIVHRLKTAMKSGTTADHGLTDPAPAADVPQRTLPVSDGAVPVANTHQMPNFSAVANLCTELARVIEPDDVPPLLERLADLLDAVGIVVWLSDPTGQTLTPALAHGYPDAMMARMSSIQRTANNATAAAFRSAQPQSVSATGAATGAIAIPLMTPSGCAGVLAAEIRRGDEQKEWVSALASIFAAQLAMLIAIPSADARRAHA